MATKVEVIETAPPLAYQLRVCEASRPHWDCGATQKHKTLVERVLQRCFQQAAGRL